MKVAVHTTLSRTDSPFCPQHKTGFVIEVMYMDGYCYTVSNKKGKAVDFWIMDKPTPKEANYIFSCRFSRYVKPKSKPIEMMLNDALNQELKSQMPSEQVAWEQGYEAGLAQGKHDRPKGEWIDYSPISWKCSCCGYGVNRWNNTPFCPNCGTSMKGGAE